MKAIFESIKNTKKKKFLFGEKPVFERGVPISPGELDGLEVEYGFKFPAEIRETLLELAAGYFEDLCFPGPDMIYPFDEETGKAEGYVTFATDIFGNYLAFNPNSENPSEIYYVCHDPLGYSLLADTILQFLEKFVESNYDNISMTDAMDLEDLGVDC